MRRPVPLLVLLSALSCATERAETPPPVATSGDPSVLRAAELARVRCLVVAPFENGSDSPLAAETATAAVVSRVDPQRVKLFPVPELRGLFRDTPLDLPPGIGPSLALELAQLIGADAVLYGSVEGRSQDGGGPELLVSMRLSLTSDHGLLFAETVLVTPASGERTDSAVRRAVLAAAGPAIARLGDTGRKRCFDPERVKQLRNVALAEAAECRNGPMLAATKRTVQPAPAPAPAPALAPASAPQPARATPRTPRQSDWARRLESGERIVLDDVAFAARTANLQRDGGLADLAVALLAQPSVAVRLEGFVDATADRAGDRKLSESMAQVAAQRLADLGVPRSQVTPVGRGGENPRLPNFTGRGRAANRRIEVVTAR